MLKFSAELKTPTVLYGGHEAYREAELLRKTGTPLLVSLKWPERGKEEDPDRVDSLRTLELRDRAPLQLRLGNAKAVTHGIGRRICLQFV